jgi:ABC-type multidrug transport system ATPase subunit
MSELQGGQKVRVLLAQALFGKPQALLLDEPTNYLDLDSIHWLQDFLHNYDGTLIAISHDRHFLNSVTTHTADIDYETIITYTGGYDDMVMAKTQIRSTLESQNAQREKKIAQLNDFIARFSAGTRSSQVTSRRKEVERLQTNDLARSNIARPYIRFDQLRPSGKHILEFKHLTKFYGDLKVLDNFTAKAMRGEKICLMGRNGAGKTTLIKSLLHNYPGLADKDFVLDSGSVSWGHEAQIGYFPQDVGSTIEHGLTVAEWLHRWKPDAHVEDIRGILGQMLFSWRRRRQANQNSQRRRTSPPRLLQAHPHQAQHINLRRAHQPLRPRSHQRPQHRPPALRRHSPVSHPRPRPHRRSSHPPLGLPRNRHRRLPRPLRRVERQAQLVRSASLLAGCRVDLPIHVVLYTNLCHNQLMPARTTIELPEPLHERLKERAQTTGVSIRSLIVRAVEDVYADTGKTPPKTGRRVTLPLIPAGGKRGPLYPVDENPHDLVFS